MLRTIWMIVEGVLAAIGVFTIVAEIRAIKYYINNPKMYDVHADMGRKMWNDKQD